MFPVVFCCACPFYLTVTVAAGSMHWPELCHTVCVCDFDCFVFVCVQIPTLLCGPFGTGKTRTLVEACFQLMKHAPTAKILVCTHVNQTADVYVKELHDRWSSEFSFSYPAYFSCNFSIA